MDFWGMFFEGILTSLTLVGLSVILPLICGIGFTVLMHFTRKNIIHRVVRYLAVFTECLAPSCLVVFIYYMVARTMDIEPFITVVATLSLSLLLYMPHRYESRDSLLKNIIVNSLGLIISAFKWSLAICSLIGVRDIVLVSRHMMARTFASWYNFVPLIFGIIVLVILHLVRNLCKDLLK